MRLEEILRQPEGKRIEYKVDLSSPQPLLRSLVAFANSAGGTLVIGVSDDRSVRGLADPLAVEARLANLIADSIAPRLVPDIDIVRWRTTNVIIVSVHLSPSRPHRMISDGSVYVRIGASNRRADPELIEEMRRSARFESFDESPYPSEPIGAIDLEAVKTEFAPRRRIKRSDLSVLGLSTDYQNVEVPTIGGLVLFERHRTAFPDATIRCARFDGLNRSNRLDSRDLTSSSLPAMVRDTMTFIDDHFSRRVVVTGLSNEVRRPIPLVAVREALVNAVVHADYSQRGGPIRAALFDDRLEIENPGLLPAGIAIEDLTTGISRVRNKVIARTFKELGYIEQWGSGIARMTEELTRAGMQPPVFEEIGGRFRITFSTAAVSTPQLAADHQALLISLRAAGLVGLSTAALARVIGKSARTTRTRMQQLVELGLAYEIGSGPNDPRRRYTANPESAGVAPLV